MRGWSTFSFDAEIKGKSVVVCAEVYLGFNGSITEPPEEAFIENYRIVTDELEEEAEDVTARFDSEEIEILIWSKLAEESAMLDNVA